MNEFNTLPEDLKEALAKAFQITEPTPIQKLTLDKMDQDAFICANTGSGKTLAYLFQVLKKIDFTSKAQQALIIVPTQELAIQIRDVINALDEHLPQTIDAEALIGGANIQFQIERLKKRKPLVLIGTPGRILTLFERRKINGQTIEILVFDEVDAMMDRFEELEAIKKAVRKSTQTLAVSATLTAEHREKLQRIMPDAENFQDSESPSLHPRIEHYLIRCEQRDKIGLLRQFLSATVGSPTLVFLNKPDQIKRTTEKLSHHHYNVAALYGEMTKQERQKAMQDFRFGVTSVLVSSDLAARGMDLPQIDQVVHLDFPLTPHAYIHRAGRTARNQGQEGISVAFVSKKEEAAIRIYERDLGIHFKPLLIANGEIYLDQERPKTEKGASKKKNTKKKKSAKAKKKSSNTKRKKA